MAYKPEETEFICNTYKLNPSMETIDAIAKHLNKNRNQIIGKLSKEGLYERKRYVDKQGNPPVTKLELVATIANYTHIDRFKLEGLDKAPKLALKALIKFLSDASSEEAKGDTEDY